MNKLTKIVEYLIYLFIFLLPLQTVWIINEKSLAGFKWHQGTILFYCTEIILVLIILLHFFFMLRQKKSTVVDRQKFLLVLTIWVLIAYAGLSIFWSSSRSLSFYWWLRLAEGVILMFIILTARFNFKLVTWSFLLSGVVQSVLAFWQFINQEVVSSKLFGIASHWPVNISSSVVGTGDYRWLRAYGSFPHPNILGGFLVVCFLAGLYLYFNSQNNWRRLMTTNSLIIITVGIFFSFSRSAWIALVVLYLVWTVIFLIKKRWFDFLKLSIYLLVIVSILITTYHQLVFTRLSFNQRLEEKSIEQRLSSILDAKEVIYHQPVLGVGLGNYINYLTTLKSGQLGWQYQPAHNLYLMVLAETGLIGFLIFLAIIIFVLYKASDFFTVTAWLAILILGLFDHYLWTSYFGLILFWLLVGLTLKDFTKSGFLEKIISKIVLEISYFTGRDFYRPDYVSLVATFRCNFRCKTCDIWKKTEFDGEMNNSEWLDVSKQLKSYLPASSFVEVSGGEALIKKDLVFTLISDLKKYFRTVVLNTNGSLINEQTVKELENRGLDRLKVSLYSLEADSHNFVRGTEIAFKNAMKTVDLVSKSKIKLEVGILITSYNTDQIPALIDYLYNLGNVDVIIQPLDEIIESNQSKSMMDNEMVVNLWPQIEKSEELFKWLKGNNFKLKNSPANIVAMAEYYLDPKRVLKYRCFAGQRNMVIYPTGDISLCFKRRFIGNLRKEKLKKIMKTNALLERKGIRACGKYCRIIGCNFSRGLLEVLPKNKS